jgi:transcriptional regulator of acetoin/glycerol metabolism
VVTPEVLAWLEAQNWPGNIRQLEQFLARAVLVTDGPRLDVNACKQVMAMEGTDIDRDMLPPVGSMTVDEVERAMIEKSLQFHAGNISKAADSLGLSRAALYRRLEKYGIGT